MASEKVLITGITGFVGRHLASLLDDVDLYGMYWPEETRIDIPGATLIRCQLEDQSSIDRVIEQVRPSVVYHLAAQSSVPRSYEDPAETYRANVMGTLHLMEALRKQECAKALLLVSSAEVYGIVSGTPINEIHPLNPNNPYAWSKLLAENVGTEYTRDFKLPVITVRPFNHIGPGQSDKFVSSSFARQIAEIEAGIRPPKIMVGNLTTRRDFTDVRDIVRAYRSAVERCESGDVYNISSGVSVQISDILDRLLALSSARVEIAEDPARARPSDLPVLSGDSSKFRMMTGWSPEIPLDTTLNDLLDYWRRKVGSGKT